MDRNKTLRKKLSYSLGANLISLLISAFTSVAIPGFFADNIANYGYFQMFVFYAGYIGFLHFGFCDGIILRDAGKKYEEINRNIYVGEFYIILVMEIIISLLVLIVSSIILSDENYRFIWRMLAVNIVIIIPKYMLAYILQAIDHVKEYSELIVIGRICFALLTVIVILMRVRKFEYFIYAQTIGEIVSLIFACWFCKDILRCKMAPFKRSIQEFGKNISVGYKLLVSNLVTLFITGISRLGIQWKYDVYVYGQTAFAFMVVNLTMSFISATEVVLYPNFKKKNVDELKRIYNTVNDKLVTIIFGCLALFYPIKKVITWLMPQYENSMKYIVYLIPMCAFSSKTSLLVRNYMKIFRMEKQIMDTDIITIIIMTGFTICSLLLSDNLIWLMLSITIAMVFRCYIAEYFLMKKNVLDSYNVLDDILIAAFFIICMTMIDSWLSVAIYIVIYAGYIVIKNKHIDKSG